VRRVLLIAAVVALLCATAASAATPAQYRAHVNAICRTYTPKFKRLEAAMTAAQKANQPKAYGVALGELLVYALAQDRQVEAVAVPASLQARMKPILARFRLADTHIRAALADARAGNSQMLLTELKAISAATNGLNTKLDAAGLRDCGSNQP
jgi:hypothetical protein